MYFGESFVPKPTQTRGTNYKFNNLLFMWVGPSGVGLHFCYCIDEKNTCSLTGIHKVTSCKGNMVNIQSCTGSKC